LIFIVAVVLAAWLVGQCFSRSFQTSIPVTMISDRTGLVMETGAQVKMRGVQVGRVGRIVGGSQPVSLKLEIDPRHVRHIPTNVGVRISATTAFGAKFVELVYPDRPSPASLTAGSVLKSDNVTTEVNTVFQNLVGVIKQVDPVELNAVLAAVAEGVGGQGERIGEATTAANQVLLAVNARSQTIRADWRALKGFGDTYDAAAQDILNTMSAASTTGATIADNAPELDNLLLNLAGFAHSGIDLIGPNKDNLVRSVNALESTTGLLMKYNPQLTCTLVGAKTTLDDYGLADYMGGANGSSLIVDVALLLGDEIYQYPDNLPITAAKGGPGGKPGCGSLPDVSKNFPVRHLVTNTGWGTGLDLRPNPGIGQHCYADWFRVTRAVPLPPAVRECLPGPAVGPQPELGFATPPYGAPQYGPDGVPLYPGVPPAPQPVTPPPEP
jgi:phospholipid/cholesterol/gamma-HCH transport system substrate-binding protein